MTQYLNNVYCLESPNAMERATTEIRRSSHRIDGDVDLDTRLCARNTGTRWPFQPTR